MNPLLPDDSRCFSCFYWDYEIPFTAAKETSGSPRPDRPGYIDICNSAGEYTPGDSVKYCEGYLPEKENP